MKIILTGSSGYLGKVLINHLHKENEVICLSRTSGEYIVELDKEIPLFKHGFDIVVHAAGLAHVSNGDLSYSAFYNVNVIGTKNLLTGLERTGIPEKIIFISSVAVYGRSLGSLISEAEDLNPKNHYGRSKMVAEKLILEWCNLNNVICTILRLPLTVGVNPPGNLASMINGIKVNRYFNIAGGKARKSMVLAQDVAQYILKAAEVGGVYNLTDGYHPSFWELSKNIATQLGKREPRNLPMFVAKIVAIVGNVLGPRSPINTDKLKKITSDLTFDDTKAREAFGWDPTPVLEGFKFSDKN